jgi:hypothetical protein
VASPNQSDTQYQKSHYKRDTPYPTAPAAAPRHQASTQLLAQVDDRLVWPVRHLMVGSGHHRKASDAIADVAVEGIALPKTSARLLVISNR